MIGWVIIVVLIVVLWLFLKARHMKHQWYAIFLVLLILFIYLTGWKIINDNNIDLNSFNGVMSAMKLYFSWLGNLFSNVRTIAGDAVKMSWANVTGIK